jgi:hypothetical protein
MTVQCLLNYICLCTKHTGLHTNYICLCTKHTGLHTNYICLCTKHTGLHTNYICLCTKHTSLHTNYICLCTKHTGLHTNMTISAAAPLLGMRVRIPIGGGMNVCLFGVLRVERQRLLLSLITRPEKTYRDSWVKMCVIVKPRKGKP